MSANNNNILGISNNNNIDNEMGFPVEGQVSGRNPEAINMPRTQSDFSFETLFEDQFFDATADVEEESYDGSEILVNNVDDLYSCSYVYNSDCKFNVDNEVEIEQHFPGFDIQTCVDSFGFSDDCCVDDLCSVLFSEPNVCCVDVVEIDGKLCFFTGKINIRKIIANFIFNCLSEGKPLPNNRHVTTLPVVCSISCNIGISMFPKTKNFYAVRVVSKRRRLATNFLVCVETNPGPQNLSIIGQERCSSSISQFSGGDIVANSHKPSDETWLNCERFRDHFSAMYFACSIHGEIKLAGYPIENFILEEFVAAMSRIQANYYVGGPVHVFFLPKSYASYMMLSSENLVIEKALGKAQRGEYDLTHMLFASENIDANIKGEEISYEIMFIVLSDIAHVGQAIADINFMADQAPRAPRSSIDHSRTADSNFLVGVEENPGPGNKMLMLYLKAMDSIENVRASTFKRTSSTSKAEEAKHKQRQKAKTQRMAELRRKRMFVPEMFPSLKVNISEDSQEFIEESLDTLRALLREGMDVNIKIPFQEEITSLLDGVRGASNVVFDFVRMIVLCISEFFDNTFMHYVRMILGLNRIQPEMFSETISLLLYKDIFTKYLAEGEFLKLVSLFTKIGSTKKDLASLTEIVTDIYRTIVAAINNAIGTDIPLFLSSTDPVDRCYATLYKLRREMANGIVSDYEFAQCAYVLREDVELIMRSAQESKVRDQCSYLLSCLRPILSYCDANINPNNGPRSEPLTMMICGPSGVGKSTFTMPVLLALMAKVLKGDDLKTFMENHNELIFYRANENEFWDGYKNKQKIIVYDDFGQRRDTAGAPNPDAFEWIRLKNTAPAHLHFSSIVDKSKHYAIPKLIYGTTNRFKLHFDSIVSNEAVIRRFDIAVIQVPKLQFCVDENAESPHVRKLDINKLRKRYPFDPEDPETFAVCDAIEFIEWDFTRGCEKAGGQTWNFDEFVNMCAAKYVELHHKGDNMLQFHRYIKTKYTPQIGDDDKSKSSILKGLDDISDGLDPLHKKVIKQCASSLNEAVKLTCSHADDLFNKFKLNVSDGTRRFFQFLSDNAIACAFGLGVSALILDTWKGSLMYANYDKAKKEVRDLRQSVRKGHSRVVPRKDENSKSGSSRMRGKGSSRKGKDRVLTRQQMKAGLHPDYINQVAVNPVSFPNHDFMMKLIRRNIYALTLNDDGHQKGFAMFVGGTTFVVPYHFAVRFDQLLDEMPEDQTLMITFCNPLTKNVCFEFDWSDRVTTVEPSNKEDWIFVKLPKGTCREHATIVESFPLKNKFIDGYTFESLLPVLRNELLQVMNINAKIGDSCTYSDGVRDYISRQITYSAPTSVGDCGAPIISCDARFGRPSILGFHVAGSGNSLILSKSCLAVSLHREDVIEALEALNEDCPLIIEDIDCDFNVEIEGFNALSKKRQPRMPTKTKLEESPFFGKLWPVTTAPAKLAPFENFKGERIDPAQKASLKYVHKEIYVPTNIIQMTTPIIKKLVLTKLLPEPWKPRLLTFEEAVSGVDGVPYVDAIARNTSPGYPFNLEGNGKKGKQYWLGVEGKVDFSSPGAIELRDLVSDCLEKAKRGIRMSHIYVDYLKDERRPLAKVEEGKTRQFMACDMILLITFKMYFGDFIRHVCQNKINNGVAVGIDPVTEWTALYSHLNRWEDTKVIAGDYSSYDAKIPTVISYAVLDIIEAFYYNATPEDKQVRRILFLEIVNSLHIRNGIVYEFLGGNPSGQPMTAVFNSIANLFMLFIVIADLEPEMEIDEISRYVRMITFGDDHIIALKASEFRNLTQDNFTVAMKNLFDYEYTNEKKDGKSYTLRDLDQVSFLKRGFRKVGVLVYPPLDLGVIRETLNYVKKGWNQEELRLRVKSCMTELAFHGKGIFDENAPVILNAWYNRFTDPIEESNFECALNGSHVLTYQ